MNKKLLIMMSILSFIIGLLELTPVMAESSSSFIMRELHAGIMIKDQGKIGNGEYFNGRGGASVDDYKVMVNSANNEFVYCIEPGVLSIDNSQYQDGNVSWLFLNAFNNKTSAESKLNNVAKLIQLVQESYRYDNGQVETRLHYMVIQTLIWEVMCEERDEHFNFISPAKGTIPITQLLRATHPTYLNRFNELYEEYEEIMFKYSMIPSFTTQKKDKAPVIELNKFDYATKEYYTTIIDEHGIVDWYEFTTSDKVKVKINGDFITISCTVADYSETISGYNTKIRGNALNPQLDLIGHKQGNNQAIVSISSLAGQRNNAFFKIHTDNYMGTLVIDPNGGAYNGNTDAFTVQSLAGETLKLSTPKRIGYSFSSWQHTGVGSLENDIYTFSKGVATVKAEWLNHKPIISSPIITDTSAFVDNGELVIQLGDFFDPLKYASAWDEEDGDITNKLIVIENEVPLNNERYTVQSGRYKVVYQVSDLAGVITQKSIYVIVNEPPVINGTNRYFFVGDEISSAVLLNAVQAMDKEDGDITHKLQISYNNVNAMTEGEYKVVFSITDNYHKTVQKEIVVYVKEAKKEADKMTLRYIGKDYLSTLAVNSKWRVDSSLEYMLNDTLNKEAIDDNCLYVFAWSNKENKLLKDKILTEGQNIDLSFFNAYRLK